MSRLSLLCCLLSAGVLAGVAQADPWVCKTKEKCLPIAGCITITTTFCDVEVGDTVTIEILSDNGTLRDQDTVVVRKVTPKPKQSSATISVGSVYGGGKKVDVTLTDLTGPNPKTIHLWAYVDTNEHIGVNLKVPR